MKIVAFLQNQWFKQPERMKLILENDFKGNRERFVSTFLFFGCATGRNLRRWLGEELCDLIIWENASCEITGEASGCPPADPEHIKRVLKKHKPTHVIAFGRIAESAVLLLPGKRRYELYTVPHPTSRQPGVSSQILQLKVKLLQEMSS